MPKRKNTRRAQSKDDKFKKTFVWLIGVAFIIVGLNGAVRTYCSSLPGLAHPHIIHACLVFTAPGLYLADIATIIIGIVIIFLEQILNWIIVKDN